MLLLGNPFAGETRDMGVKISTKNRRTNMRLTKWLPSYQKSSPCQLDSAALPRSRFQRRSRSRTRRKA
jgi:hypothetical protein